MRFPTIGLVALAGCALPFCPAQALMTFGGSNSTNITDPGNGLPWRNVVEIENSLGVTDGSGVYLGNQFVLTANHVGPVSQINIGGTLFFVDTSFSDSYAGGSFSGGFSQIGSTDLKVVRLTQNPATSGVTGLQTINLNTSAVRDVDPFTTNYIVGYGEGKGTAVVGTGTGGWNWDAGSIGAERWGTNNVAGISNGAVNGGMTTNTLVTTFDSTSGADEAAVELGDSGGTLFVQSGGTWYLTGITLYVSTNGTSYYDGDPNNGGGPSVNFFGRISDYESTINAAIAVPEPGVSWLLLGGLGTLLVLHRCRTARAR